MHSILSSDIGNRKVVNSQTRHIRVGFFLTQFLPWAEPEELAIGERPVVQRRTSEGPELKSFPPTVGAEVVREPSGERVTTSCGA